MSKPFLYLFLFFNIFCATAQKQEKLFEQSFALLHSMIDNDNNYSFKKAVFSVENAYLEDKLDTIYINNQIKLLSTF